MIKVCAVENISARDNFFTEFSLFRISFDEILCDIYDETARALNLKVKKNSIYRERFYSRGQQRCKLVETQKSVYTRKKGQSPQNLFLTPIWPPFHCLETPTWLRHVNPIYIY